MKSVGKLTDEEIRRLPTTGERGLLREMYESPHKAGWATKQDIRNANPSRDGGQLNKYLGNLLEKKDIEKGYKRVKKRAWRPDAVAYDLPVVVNYVFDRLTFMQETRRRFRITCKNCGDSHSVLFRQLWRRLLPCLKCGYQPRVAEYPPLMEQS